MCKNPLWQREIRQRRQISASARRQSCRSKQRLRACSTPQAEATIVEQALSSGKIATVPVLGIGPVLAISFLACGLFASSAHAQTQAPLLDQYIPPTQGGGGGFQSVLTRYQPEYSSPGIPLGNFTIRPGLNETAGYDSNVFATKSAKGSAIIETNASLGASSDWSDTDRVQLALGVDDVRYPNQPVLSNTNWNTTIGGSHGFGQDLATATYSHQAATILPSGLDVPQLAIALPYSVDDFQANYRINLARSYIQPSIDVSSYTLGTNNTANYSASNFNRVQVSPTVTLGYEFATQRDLVVVIRDTNATYTSHALPGIANPNYNDVAVLSGLDYSATGVVRFRFLLGYEIRSFQSTQYKTTSAPVAEASVIWTPTGLTAVTGTASRTIQASANGTTPSFTQNYVQVRLDHEYLPNVLFRADTGVYFNNYNQGGGDQTLFTIGAGVTYLVNRNIRLVFGYDFTARQSSGLPVNAGAFGANYSDHRVTLQVRLSL